MRGAYTRGLQTQVSVNAVAVAVVLVAAVAVAVALVIGCILTWHFLDLLPFLCLAYCNVC